MKLISLYANNFKKLKFDNSLRFPDGITVISGLNESGKSTILDAILYALYGKVIRPPGVVKNTDLIGYAASRATVVLEFSIRGKTYRIKREIYRNRANTANLDEVLSDGSLKSLAVKIKDVTAAVEKTLGGITFNEVVSSNVVAQKDLDRLVREGGDRKKVINAFLNLESFNTVVADLNEQRKDLDGTGISRRGRIAPEQEKLTILQSELSEFNRRRNEAIDLRTKIEKLKQEISTLESDYEMNERFYNILASYDAAVATRENLKTQLESKKAILNNHREQLSSILQQIKDLEAKVGKYSGLPSNEAISRIQELLNALKEADRIKNEVGKQAKEVADEIGRLEGELMGFNKEDLEKARKARTSIKPYVVGSVASFATAFILFFVLGLIPSFIMGAIGLILLAKLTHGVMQIGRLARLEGLLGTAKILEEKGKELYNVKNIAAESAKEVTKLVKSLADALQGLVYYESLMKEKENPKAAAESVLVTFTEDIRQKGNLESSINSLRKSLEEAEKKIDTAQVQSEMYNLDDQISKIEIPQLPPGMEFSKGLLNEVSLKKEKARGDVENRKGTITTYVKTIDENNNYIEEHKDIEEKVKSQDRVIKDLEHESKVVKTSIDGIERTAEMLRTRVRPSVERYMGQILPSITSGKYKAVMLDESFAVQVWDPDAGEFRPKDVFSGGTEDQFLLAMRLAFALALLPEVKGAKSDFLFLDEPLGSSDEVRRSGIIEYINLELSKLFEQIFIISHVGGLEELVPNVIWLENGRVTS